jgi:hypothetical protein
VAPVPWRSRGFSVCMQFLRYCLAVTVLQILSCSNYQSDTFANENSPTEDDAQAMTQNAKYLKQFNQLYLKISNETNRSSLDAHQDDVDSWRMNWELDSGDVNLAIAGHLGSILEDQVNRKQEQLRSKPGRQPAVDWIRELDDHARRLAFELGALQLLRQGEADIDESISLISKSMDLSVRVIAADQDQIQKQVSDGFITLTPEDEALLQTSNELSKQANDWLNMHRPN